MRITFIGDIMCQKEQSQSLYKRYGYYKYKDTFSSIRHLLLGSDIVIGNLETPLAGEICGYTNEASCFNTPDAFAEALQYANINFVSIANNHILDRGINGLDRTIQILNNNNISHTGAYSALNDSDKIYLRSIKGIKIAILSFTYGTNSEFYGEPLPEDETWRVDLLRAQLPNSSDSAKSSRRPLKYFIPHRVRLAMSALTGKKNYRIPDYIADNVDPDQIEREIDIPYLTRAKNKILEARELADIVVVLPHMGGQYNPSPGYYTRHMVEWIARHAPDAIIANHPHVPLGCHMNSGILTAYSLGNFCFNPSDGCYVPGQYADYGIVLHMDLCTQRKRIRSVSFEVTKTVLEPDGAAVVRSVSDYFRDTPDPLIRQKLMIDNEAVVNRFRGGCGSVSVHGIHELPFPTTHPCHTPIEGDC